MGNDIRVIIIDNESSLGDYVALINAQDGYVVPNTYTLHETTVIGLVAAAPDVILFGVEPWCINKERAIARLKKIAPDVPVLILTADEHEDVIFGALGNGASGFFNTTAPADKLIDAIKEVKQGGTPMSLNIARLIISSFQKNHDSPLSKRETQVLELIGNGKSRFPGSPRAIYRPGNRSQPY
ncbi:hypothetical protein BH09BAC6_BH09BAC6_30190 [soil metagenome]